MTSSEEKDMHPSLIQFAQGESLNDRVDALTTLLAAKALQKSVKFPLFERGLEHLIKLIGESQNDRDRLTALAQAVRIAQSARALTNEIKHRISPLLDRPLAPAQLLDDADSRAYVAKACGWSLATWVYPYAISEIANEDTAEKARAEFVQVAFSRAQDVSELLSRLEDELVKVRFTTGVPADSVAARLVRVLSAVRVAMVVSRLSAGQGTGEKFARLVRLPLSESGTTTNRERLLSLSREIVLSTYELVRTHFSLATDADTYAPLRVAKKLIGGTSWPKELHDDLQGIVSSMSEALLLLAKQGFTPNALVSHLEIVLDNRVKVDTLLREMADSHPELDEHVRRWLRRSEVGQATARDTVSASQDLRLDPHLGRALIEAGRVEAGLSDVGLEVMPLLQLSDPRKAQCLDSHLKDSRILLQMIEDMARLRRLAVFGQIGAEVDFAPKYFEQIDSFPGIRVRVLRPAIVRMDEAGLPGDVVVKGLVQVLN